MIQLLDGLRAEGVRVYETMDAGPQVKCLCLEEDVEQISSRLRRSYPNLGLFELKPAHDPLFEARET